MGDIRRNMSFACCVILNLIVSLYLMFVDKQVIFGVVLILFGAVIVIFYKNNKTIDEKDISNDEISAVLPSMPFHITISDVNRKQDGGNLINRLFRIFLRCNNTQYSKQHKTTIKTKDGKQYLSHKKEIKDSNDNLLGMATIEIDVTDIMKYQEYLLNQQKVSSDISQKDIGDLVLNNSDGILVFAYNNTEKKVLSYVDSNNSMREMLHISSKDIVNTNLLDLFHTSERERVETIIHNMISSKPILFESLMVDGDSYFPVEIGVHICKIYNQEAVYFSVRDVRLRKEQEAKRDRNRILSIRYSQTNTNLYLLHCLFAKISKYANSIKEYTKNIEDIYIESKKEVLEIDTQVESITNTIQDLILFYTPTNIKTNVNIKSLLERIQKIIFSKDILNNTIMTIVQKDEIGDIYCNEDALKYCLVAVIRNSIENISINKGTSFYGKIDITLQKVDNNVLISIEDNAGGIEEDSIDRIFDVFYSNKNHSAGLGLPMCRILLEDVLFGSIDVSNTDYGVKINILIAIL